LLREGDDSAGADIMVRFSAPALKASLVVLGLAAVAVGGPARLAHAADIHFTGGQDNTDNSWTNPENWSSNPVLPGKNDAVTIDAENPDVGANGAVITDTEKVKSLDIDASLAVLDGGKLTAADGITNNGIGYFTNNGVVTVQTDGGTPGTVTNTYTDVGSDNDPSNDYAGYIGNSRKFNANLDNSGDVINGGEGTEDNHVIWLGNVINRATGTIITTNGATWQGDVTSNSGSIYNQVDSTWKGNIVNNSNDIENDQGSLWQGDVQQNSGVVINSGGSVWQGNVDANTNSIDNDGGTWNGDLLSNTGTVFNTAVSVWNGDMTSSGDLWLSGVVNGSVTNNGGTVHIYEPLSGVTSFVNNGGGLDMDDGDASGSFSAQSWSGSGTGNAAFDFAPGLGRVDHVVLSGDYSADTDISLSVVGPAGRALGDIPLISVGGTSTGTVSVSGLPDDGVVSYRLVQSGQDWVIASVLNAAPAHVADMVGEVGDALAAVTQLPVDHGDLCGRGAWTRALGGTRSAALSDQTSHIDFGGVQVGYDFPCFSLGSTGARVGFGASLGAVTGTVAETFAGNDSLTGNFGQGFAGFYGDVAAGALHAIVQSQIGFTGSSFNDRQSLIEGVSLVTSRFDLSGDASYDLALGGVDVTPGVGFSASSSQSTGSNFADVGGFGLMATPAVDVHAGATVSTDIALPNGSTTLSPFASVAYHGGLVAPGTAVFIDDAGGTAAVPVAQLGNYVALGVGAKLLSVPTASGTGLDGSLRADVKIGAGGTDAGLDGHLGLQF